MPRSVRKLPRHCCDKDIRRTDPLKNTRSELFRLIDDVRAGKINVEMYAIKYAGTTEALVNRNALSKFDRNVWFLEGLSDDVRLKVFEYGSEERWRMLEIDEGMTDPEFEELKREIFEGSDDSGKDETVYRRTVNTISGWERLWYS